MSLSTTEQSKTTIKFDTGITTMYINVENGNPLDIEVAESLCNIYEASIPAIKIVSWLKKCLNWKGVDRSDVVIRDYEKQVQGLRQELSDAEDGLTKIGYDEFIDTGSDRLFFKLEKGNLQDTDVMESIRNAYELGVSPIKISAAIDGLTKK